MSKINEQMFEITRYLFNHNVKDVDSLYEKLVVNRKKKIKCFTVRKIDEKNMRIMDEDISLANFKRIVRLMENIVILTKEPLTLLDDSKKELRGNIKINFSKLLKKNIESYFSARGISISSLKKDVIKNIQFPSLRNHKTIHKKVKKLMAPTKIVSAGDFSKLLTLLSDIGIIKRDSSIQYVE